MHIEDIIRAAFELGVSDVHITVNSAPAFRLHGLLIPIDSPELAGKINIDLKKLTAEDTKGLARELMSGKQYEKFLDKGEIDFSCDLPELCRLRVNVYKQRNYISMAIRLINSEIPSFEKLGIPEVLISLVRKTRGLVLVTGPTGSGKSTTLAAMIDLINREKSCHIITLEDPIEYVHHHKKSVINQREIGIDTETFASALRAALREDPDVILVGEMRDPETIATAITAAETGHLVFATLHTSSASQTIDRIIDVFPPHQQQQIKIQLANTIQGIIAQQLIPRADKTGRVAAFEILLATPAIRNLIREGKTYQIISQIQTGSKFGMKTLDASLSELCRKGLISKEELLNRAADVENMKRLF
ncbi:type IV pilus twitching motility protein PilT [Desulfolucanica intricata]|uniref:type IV pilus twitching motility protein PilT n=1 Tax=Desulfolucanica intricata TaxID=1285191 RepID=UPI000837604A|nr:type IV pilus twitching motility protein PilT [Desulfolucanica intricata]